MNSTSKTCIICGKSYSAKQKSEVTTKIVKETLGTLASHPNTCLTCIQAQLSNERDSTEPYLKQACLSFKAAKAAYQRALLTKQRLANQHRDADQQQAFIKFFLQQAKAPTKPAQATKRKPSAKRANAKSKQTALINTLLASMTPEQRSSIASAINKLPASA